MPRLLRFATLCGDDYAELDFPASHGGQILKYARVFGLPADVLEQAFSDRSSIAAFRLSFAPLAASSIKGITNMLAYGNGGAAWCKKCGLSELPARLGLLKQQVRDVAAHNYANCPQEWRDACSTRPRPILTCMSLMCQRGERRDLDLCGEHLPAGVKIFGYLGDSMLVTNFDEAGYVQHMQTLGVLIERKPLPRNLSEYMVEFAAITGQTFNSAPVPPRQVRIDEAFAYAYRYLHDKAFAESCSHFPHVVFAIAVENSLSVHTWNNRKEYYNDTLCRWEIGGEQKNAGEDLSEILIKTFSPKIFTWALTDGKRKRVPTLGPMDISRFFNATYLSPIGTMCNQLKPRNYVELDASAEARKIRMFEGGTCLDFGRPPPVFDWEDDVALAIALNFPRRAGTKMDRIFRCTGVAFEDYVSPERFNLARLIQTSCMYRPSTFCAHKNDVGGIGGIGVAVWRIGRILADVGGHRAIDCCIC
jgi:hypothetical protein